MKNKWILRIILISGVLCSGGNFLTAAEQTLTVVSPNGKLKAEIHLGESLSYSVSHNDRKILLNSDIGIVLDDGTQLGERPQIISKKVKKVRDDVSSPFYRFSRFVASCNELDLKLRGNYGVIFRAYDEGIAYRFYTTHKNGILIKNEVAEFNFDQDYTLYLSHSTNEKEPLATAFQNIYSAKPLSESSSQLAFLPATVDYGNGLKMTLLESDLASYPGMFLRVQSGKNALKGVFAQLPAETALYPWRQQEYIKTREASIARVKGTRAYPWRILAVTEKDTDMPVNNLVYALAPPSRIEDPSWIKPGKSAWEWWNDWGLKGVPFKAGINTETYKHYIDFASRNGIEYVILDEGWYTPQSGDILTVIPDIDLPELIAYGKSRGVELMLWTVFNVLDSQLEAACRNYSEMGIKGFKVDFLDRDDQAAVEKVYRIAEATAKHRLVLDLHGIYKPTGLNRTYPNVLNFEGVFGMEEVKWSEVEKDMPLYDVTFPYIRMMAGPVDYTPGAMRNASRKDFRPVYYHPMSMGTRCHQLAAYIVHDSPLTMLCDAPTQYDREQECVDFMVSIPVETDETRILAGEMGKYIVSARRKEINWYVGGMTNWDERTVVLDFSFLEEGATYRATLFSDGINADKNAEDYQVTSFLIDRTSKHKIHLAPGGGFALKLERTYLPTGQPAAVPEGKGFPSFYKKYLDAGGIPVLSSEKVEDAALLKAHDILTLMLAKRADVKEYMLGKGCRIMIIGRDEEVCELPEYAHICDTPENIAFWNKRARGFGGAPEDDYSASCGEENLLALPGDRYTGENILIHEFAHLIHLVGIVGTEPGFNDELEAIRLRAIEKGLWKDTYAITNKEEYFAEGVQSFFNCNRYSETPNGVHNSMNRRVKLKAYDPELYQLLKRYFYEIEIPINNEIHQ